MTFVGYARARRMGSALKSIKSDRAVMEAPIETGYESSSGFRDAFSKIMGSLPSLSLSKFFLRASWIDMQLGTMLAIVDDKALYLLGFVNCRGLEREIERLRKKSQAAIIPGLTPPLKLITTEISKYFAGELREFTTPLSFLGSPFPLSVWKKFREIPFDEIRSYGELATQRGNELACRAMAQANGTIPCHRIIKEDGKLGGYGGGITRKKWLLDHESKISKKKITFLAAVDNNILYSRQEYLWKKFCFDQTYMIY